MPNLMSLSEWPETMPVGIIAMGTQDTVAFTDLLKKNESILKWWRAEPQNMFVGPAVKPPFEVFYCLEVANPAVAGDVLSEIETIISSAGWTIYLSKPSLPPTQDQIMRFDAKPVTDEPNETIEELTTVFGGANPTRAQLKAFDNLPLGDPVMILNLNNHVEKAVNPDTGETCSGYDLANLYLKRGIKTFTSLGARPIWTGSGKAVLRDDLDAEYFDQIGLILYPTRQHFAAVMRIGMKEGWDRYRQAGYDRSWNVHCRITASNEIKKLADVVATSTTKFARV